jgi:hypothetical protein
MVNILWSSEVLNFDLYESNSRLLSCYLGTFPIILLIGCTCQRGFTNPRTNMMTYYISIMLVCTIFSIVTQFAHIATNKQTGLIYSTKHFIDI